MYTPPLPPPRPTTTWACPVAGCDYEELGLPERAYGDGVCEKSPAHGDLLRKR
ncbi:hypothetical protein ACSHWB_43645 [Lentzea sp. HUAS TT2]|uniref:hypothetical protein n=1 Tax=Lentzea sp. HUAS TT2 TaxID=3447454 RepID=UPI003F7224C8